jgi:hypothetical protein
MNEWLRKHKAILMTFAGLAVIGTGLWGVLSLMTGDPVQGTRGPHGWYYAWDGHSNYVSPEELFQARLIRWHFYGGPQWASPDALRALTQYTLVSDWGFNVGQKELDEIIRMDIQNRTGATKVTRDLYKRLLDNMQLTAAQYERLVRERATLFKYLGALQQAKVTDGALFVNYCRKKQELRAFYREFRSEAYENVAPAPSDAETKKYYDDHQKREEPERDNLFTKTALSVDVLYIPAAEVTRLVKPGDEDLRKHYENTKQFYLKDPTAPPPPLGQERPVKAFEEVKEQVLKSYVEEHLFEKANELVKQWEKDLLAEEDKLTPEARKLDWAAFAQARGLKHWRTKMLTEAEFGKGEEKVAAPDFRLAADNMLFRLAETSADAQTEKTQQETRRKLIGARRILGHTPEDGYVAMRLAERQEARPMTLSEATPIIQRRLKEEKATQKAREAADDFREKWATGKELPKAADLKDETLTGESDNPLIQEFLKNPVPVGELLPVVTATPDPELVRKQPDTRLTRHLVGFIGRRQLPGYEGFEQEPEQAAREGERRWLEYVRQDWLRNAGGQFLSQARMMEYTREPDPPLGQVGGAPPPDM